MATSGLPAGKELGNQQMEAAFGMRCVAIPVQDVLYGKRDALNEENVSEMTPWLESWIIKVQKEASCRITEREEWEAYSQARDEANFANSCSAKCISMRTT
ncbi:MAG: hypothetical protein LBR78_02075 [Holosporales bacterium]|nr:hypothetical protein [Holosporales bacterium]